MSLNGAINTAAMGLRATQTLSRVNAENVANSATPGYTRRKAIATTADGATAGPIVTEIRREVDSTLARMARTEIGKMAKHQTISEALKNYTAYYGQPGDGLSPVDKFSAFKTSLTTLVNSPSSNEAQYGAVVAADDLAQSLQRASNSLTAIRSEVDMQIRYEVSDLNQALYDLASVNRRILEVNRGTQEAAHLGDRMDNILDSLSGMIDFRAYENSDGTLNIYTSGGAALLERSLVQDVTFNAGTGTLSAGALDITPNKAGVRGLTDGSLTGLLQLKSEIFPRFQLQLDEYARGLMASFESSDATLSNGQPGLFTDGGSPFNATNLTGLASRITVNSAVSSLNGGETWRIRDGLGASIPGDVSDNSQIQSFLDALQQPLNAASETGISPTVTVSEFAAQFVSSQNLERVRSQEMAIAAQSSAEITMASRMNFEGVNIDEEMQDLQIIQQSYAANSRVLTTVLGMIDTLLDAV